MYWFVDSVILSFILLKNFKNIVQRKDPAPKHHIFVKPTMFVSLNSLLQDSCNKLYRIMRDCYIFLYIFVEWTKSTSMGISIMERYASSTRRFGQGYI